MTQVSDLVDRLAQHRALVGAPRPELEWLAAHGVVRRIEPGNYLAQLPEARTSMGVVFSGRFAIYVDHGAGPHRVFEWAGGDLSGLMPYSRLTTLNKPIGEMIVDEAGDLLLVDVRDFPELIRDCPDITTRLVHVMVDRARHFRSSELQDEKMLSLGRLSAGLAHELNNPASAAARSAQLLLDSLAEAETTARALGAARLTDAQLAVVDGARQACVVVPPSALSPIERADREEALSDWLEQHGGDPNTAAQLAESAVTLETLDRLAATVEGDALQIAIRWVAAGCTTRALAAEVERAARRIHTLVAAIKRHTYMDRALVPEAIDLAQSINDAVALLLHKARQKSASLAVKLEPQLPKVRAIGGDLNQVWMNLIDNALDAVPETGHVSVSAARQLDRVIVRVVDDGSGIAPEIADRIFDPFITSKPVGQGTGLGLDIARQLIRRNAGDIEVASRPGHTEFRVTLPIAER